MTQALIVAAILCWIATGYRLITTLRSPTLWSASFTAGVGFLAAGVTTFLAAGSIDRATGVYNLALLLMHVLVGLSGGCVVLFVITLRHDHVDPRAIRRTVLTCLGAVGLMVATWSMAPIHDREYSDLALAPLTAPALGYFAVWYVYLVIVLATTARWCWSEVHHPQPPGIWLGIQLIGMSTTLGAFSFAIAGGRIALRYFTHQRWEGLSVFMRVASAVSVAGIAIGTVIFLLGPRVAAAVRVRRLEHGLTPLARRVGQLYPTVIVQSAVLDSPTIRVQRLRTEVLDGLNLLPITPGRLGDVQLIAQALRNPPMGADHRAAELIPPVTTEQEEDEWLLSLARAFQRR